MTLVHSATSLSKTEEESKDEDEQEDDANDVQGSLLLATGSADTSAYIFDSGKVIIPLGTAP